MKTRLILLTTLLLLLLTLNACTTVTETRPDGTVIKTESIDNATVNSGLVLTKLLIDSNNSK